MAKIETRLKDYYIKEVVPYLMKQHGYSNIHEVPKLEKIVLNMGLGAVKDNTKSYNLALDELTAIAGQKAVPTVAKKAISNFKIRKDLKIGAKVTLRGSKMYQFLDRLVAIALPRLRDFRGISPRSFDGKGNYALGLKEQLVFPEIVFDKVEKIRGLDVMIITSAKTDKEALDLLKALGMPFRDR